MLVTTFYKSAKQVKDVPTSQAEQTLMSINPKRCSLRRPIYTHVTGTITLLYVGLSIAARKVGVVGRSSMGETQCAKL